MRALLNFLIVIALLQLITISAAAQQRLVNGGLPVVSPDGRWIVFSSNKNGTNDLYIIDVDGSNEKQLTHTPEYESISGWTPNRKQLIFSVFKNNTTSIYSI